VPILVVPARRTPDHHGAFRRSLTTIRISIECRGKSRGVGSVNGEYVGVDNAFDYRTTALSGTQANLDRSVPARRRSRCRRALNLDYTETIRAW